MSSTAAAAEASAQLASVAPWRTTAAAWLAGYAPTNNGGAGSTGLNALLLQEQQRTKRLAISAEPLPLAMGSASLAELRKLRIQRAPKSQE